MNGGIPIGSRRLSFHRGQPRSQRTSPAAVIAQNRPAPAATAP
jgi:hypothetical protein